MTKSERKPNDETRMGPCNGAVTHAALDQVTFSVQQGGGFDGPIMRDPQSIVAAGPRREICTPQPASGTFLPLLWADWVRAVFIHLEVEPEVLQNEIPFALDLWQGRAFVSLVAFTMERLRPRMGGRLSELAFKPIANTRFLNVRTYVKHRGEAGIYFIAEFLSNRWFVPLGRPSFGLPYRCGALVYRHDCEDGTLEGSVTEAGRGRRLSYRAGPLSADEPEESRPGTLDFFLLERYAAFTCDGTKRRRFRIWHPRWRQVRIEPSVHDDGWLATTGRWIGGVRLAGGNYSAGVRGVAMGRPVRIHPAEPRRRLTVFFDV